MNPVGTILLLFLGVLAGAWFMTAWEDRNRRGR